MHFVTLHFIDEIFGIPENVPRFLKNVFHIPDKRQLGLASLLNEGGKYCRMLLFEHSAILLTCMRQEFVLQNNFWSFFEWPLKTGFTVHPLHSFNIKCILRF